MAEHAVLDPDLGIHAPFAWTYSSAANRAAHNPATGPATALGASDNHKFALQTDNNTVWILTDYSGPTWKQINGTTGVQVDGAGLAFEPIIDFISSTGNLAGADDAANGRTKITLTATPTWTSETVVQTGLGATEAAGHTLKNTTASTSGSPQYSPQTIWQGQGWDDSGSMSTPAEVAIWCRPIEFIGSPPWPDLVLGSRVGGVGAWSPIIHIVNALGTAYFAADAAMAGLVIGFLDSAASGPGGLLKLNGQAAVDGDGGDIQFRAEDGNGTNRNGGSVYATLGGSTGTGTTGTFYVEDNSSNKLFEVDTTKQATLYGGLTWPEFTTLIAGPYIQQLDATSGSGQNLTIGAQNSTAGAGGQLILTSGTGTTFAGSVDLQVGGVSFLTAASTSLSVGNSTQTLYFYGTHVSVVSSGFSNPLQYTDKNTSALATTDATPTAFDTDIAITSNGYFIVELLAEGYDTATSNVYHWEATLHVTRVGGTITSVTQYDAQSPVTFVAPVFDQIGLGTSAITTAANGTNNGVTVTFTGLAATNISSNYKAWTRKEFSL